MTILSFNDTLYWYIMRATQSNCLLERQLYTSLLSIQARRQEMKSGMFFCKKVENGVFVKKWKMGVFCKKSGKWGCVVKSGLFLNAGCIMYSISIFYFTFYLFGGGAYASNAPTLPTGL